jgi:hypothetical protein
MTCYFLRKDSAPWSYLVTIPGLVKAIYIICIVKNPLLISLDKRNANKHVCENNVDFDLIKGRSRTALFSRRAPQDQTAFH